MSTTNDTYEAGLIAAMNALDTRLTHRYVGVVDAYVLIAEMVSDYRKAIA